MSGSEGLEQSEAGGESKRESRWLLLPMFVYIALVLSMVGIGIYVITVPHRLID